MPARPGSVPYDPSKATTSISGLLSLGPSSSLSAAQKVTLSAATLNVLQSASDMMSGDPSTVGVGEILNAGLAAQGQYVEATSIGGIILPSSVSGVLPRGATRTQGFTIDLSSDMLVQSGGSNPAATPLYSDLAAMTFVSVSLSSEVPVAEGFTLALSSSLVVLSTGTTLSKKSLGSSLVVRSLRGENLSSDVPVAEGLTLGLASDLPIQVTNTLAVDSDILTQIQQLTLSVPADLGVATSATSSITSDVICKHETAVSVSSDVLVAWFEARRLGSDVLVRMLGVLGLTSDLYVVLGDPTPGLVALSSGLAVETAGLILGLDSDLYVEEPDPGQITSFPSLDSDMYVNQTSGGLSNLASDVVVSLWKNRKFLFSTISVQGTVDTMNVPLASDLFVV